MYWFIAWRQGDTTFHMFVLKMYVQIMSLSVLLCNVCVCYVYILKMSKKIKVKKKKIIWLDTGNSLKSGRVKLYKTNKLA